MGNENTPVNGYALYPNPATESIVYQGPTGAVIMITDPAGRTVKSLVATPGSVIPVGDLSPGLWYFRIIAPSGEYKTFKITIL